MTFRKIKLVELENAILVYLNVMKNDASTIWGRCFFLEDAFISHDFFDYDWNHIVTLIDVILRKQRLKTNWKRKERNFKW